ncbi:hypothetical protein D8B34_08395 [Verminephrobacter eiseniae]|uniref:hypothetical protein n=1 Tax=Verminephrobacter eiseniae TaxID=364317 RepID=UPI002237AECC|nr:hypothetical protein [Verminephrobacter eiseniae]MCW5233626.1 hypothetical protein [Verminephrobacter eiseniae]MCW8185565.1 hypothetical protein [Verminephrobacter eiseniae]MCW8222070.1 hypothetical protein [Verminephrobacter eiseniae]MCW8233796.1 hypothetical protein [Verminephrobacter eiseniae]
MSRHRSSVGLRWPSKCIAALHRLPIRSVLAARCALRCAPMAARSLRHLISDTTLRRQGHQGRHQGRSRYPTPAPVAKRWMANITFGVVGVGGAHREPAEPLRPPYPMFQHRVYRGHPDEF